MAIMKSEANLTVPLWFKIIAGVALVWNLMGVMAFVSEMMMTPELIARLSQPEQDLYANLPMWATAAFALAVTGGALGCLLLVLRKGLAVNVLVLSLVGVLIQMFHSFFMSDSFEVYGLQGAIMPIMVVLVAIALVVLARFAQSKQWLI